MFLNHFIFDNIIEFVMLVKSYLVLFLSIQVKSQTYIYRFCCFLV